MKNIFLSLLIITVLSACSNTEQKQTDNNVDQADNSNDATENRQKSKEVAVFTDYQDNIKEALFFQLRESIEGLGEYRFLKSEQLVVVENQFEYTLVTLPEEYIEEYQQEIEVLEAAAYGKKKTISDDDSIKIFGEIIIDSIFYSSAEKVEEIKLTLEGEFFNSYKSISPYAGPERVHNIDAYWSEMIVNVSTPGIYSKDQYYLKARIMKLTAAELKDLSNDELSYLRNEIFARHGHTFKTEKMSNYFASKPWYKAYVTDATPWLNEQEKWNAQYIKSFEK